MIYNKYAERERLVPKVFPWLKWNGDRRLMRRVLVMMDGGDTLNTKTHMDIYLCLYLYYYITHFVLESTVALMGSIPSNSLFSAENSWWPA